MKRIREKTNQASTPRVHVSENPGCMILKSDKNEFLDSEQYHSDEDKLTELLKGNTLLANKYTFLNCTYNLNRFPKNVKNMELILEESNHPIKTVHFHPEDYSEWLYFSKAVFDRKYVMRQTLKELLAENFKQYHLPFEQSVAQKKYA